MKLSERYLEKCFEKSDIKLSDKIKTYGEICFLEGEQLHIEGNMEYEKIEKELQELAKQNNLLTK
jgi:hypothetical protein